MTTRGYIVCPGYGLIKGNFQELCTPQERKMRVRSCKGIVEGARAAGNVLKSHLELHMRMCGGRFVERDECEFQ